MRRSQPVLLAVLHLLLLVRIARGVEPASQYYRELGCTPPDQGSSTAYNCSILESLSPDKCFYNKKEYAVNEVLRGEDIQAPCTHECICQKSYVTNKANWQCVHIECPEVFNPPKEGCFSLYEKDSCCSVRTYCPKEEKEPLATCEYGGRTYVEGQRFDAEDQCMSCVCKKGFNGSLVEPYCSKLKCDLYLHYSSYIQDGCLPTYYQTNNCCPIPIWRCPNEDDQVITQKVAQEEPSGARCRFGRLELAVGQALSPTEDNKCVECKCLAPPHPSCVMNTTCYSNQ